MGRDFGVNIVTIPQVTALFLYAVNNPEKGKGLIQEFGKRYSMYVYIVHILVWQLLQMVYQATGLSTNLAACYFMPILVVLFSFLFSMFLYRLNHVSQKI